MEPGEEARTSRLALLVAAACVLQIAESMLPHPLPGLRLGLANTLTLIAPAFLSAANAKASFTS